MAQHKYDILTVPTVSEGPRRHHPWYKERLRLKFINPSQQTAALNGQRWTFVANDIDDFRTGVPSKTRGKRMVKHGRVGSLPLISTSKTSHKTLQPESKIMSINPGRRTLYSKVGPRRQVQQERLERAKSTLLKHPLQLYSHLEDSIPIELLDGVLEVVDPEMKNAIDSSESSSSRSESLSSVYSQCESADRLSDTFSPAPILDPPDRQQEHPQQSRLYRFPLKKTNEEKEREKLMVASQQVISASQQSRVDQVTCDLVQWMEDMGGNNDDQHSIDESRIKSLFSSDYESKPVQVAPIHVVELVNVPAELRLESRDHSRSGYSSSPSLRYASDNQYQYGRTRGFTHPGTDYEEPRYVKSKYGAWYLPVDLWRLRNENEPLRDPKEMDADLDSEDAMKGLAMDEMLSELHGAKSFKEFILTKKRGSVMPQFLEGVDLDTSQTQKHQLLKFK